MNASQTRTFVVVFAGGVGSRMKGADRPKQFLQLGGKPIIAHTLDHFQQSSDIEAIVVSCVSSWIQELRQVIEQFHLNKVHAIVSGGDTGQDSIYNGLTALDNLDNPPRPDDVVLVHDGVRPLITQQAITDCISSVCSHGCTAVTAPATETVVVENDGEVEAILDRSQCRLARAPQGFRFGEILACHNRARAEGRHDFIDSVSLMAHYGYVIHTVDGPEENIKITTPRDFFAFKSFVDMKEVAQIWEP